MTTRNVLRVFSNTILCALLIFILLPVSAAWSAAPPAAPSNLQAAPVSSTQISLSWIDNSTDETGFSIERSTSSTGTYSVIATVGANVTSYADLGLFQNSPYYYRVRAYRSTTYSKYSNTASATTFPLRPPTIISATVSSATQINLAWTDTNYETRYDFQRATNSIGPYFVIGSVGADVTTYADTGVAQNTAYYYRIVAFDGTNYSQSNTVAASTSMTITASAGTGGTITPSGTVSVSYGSSQTFTIIPNMDYHISDVLVDGASVGAVSSYVFTNVTANHTITARFAPSFTTINGGTISTNTTWTLAGSPYVITGDVYVSGSGSPTLTIEPGVVVKFNQNTSLYIGVSSWGPGALSAVGTADAPITFTSNQATPTPGYWGGIYFDDATVDANTVLSYVTVEYGGYHGPGYVGFNLKMNSASPTIMNSTIRNSSDYGIYDSTGSAVISGNTFTGNGSYPVRMGINQVGNVNTYGTNGVNAVELARCEVGQNLTMKNNGIPYIATCGVYVYGSGSPTLTIEAGVVVKFNQNTTLHVGYGTSPGALSAVGTAAAPITFTSNQATPTAGYWGGIYFHDSTVDANTTLSYVNVEYGGYLNNSNLYIISASPTIMNSTIRKSSGYGIYTANASPRIQNTVITDNGWSGIYGSSSSFTATGNTVTNNGTYGIYDVWGSTAVISGNTFIGNGSYPVRMGINQVNSVNTYGTNGINAIEVAGGTVSQNLTMKNNGIPYVVGSVSVYGSGSPTLTIEPGVVVKFNQNGWLSIGNDYDNTPGALSAVGTAAAPITFTSNQATPTPGYWGGIYFYNGTVDANTVLSYVTVEYGGYNIYSHDNRGFNLYINAASPTIMNSTIRKSSGHGIYAYYASPAIQNNVITDNETAGLYGDYSSFTATGNTIMNNGTYGIYDSMGSAVVISGNAFTGNGSYPVRMAINQVGNINTYGANGGNAIELIGGTVGQNLTMKNHGIPYIVTGSISVYGTPTTAVTFTIEPGTTAKFGSGAGLQIGNGAYGGVLIAQGAAASGILFTSSQATPAPGNWNGITLSGNAAGASVIEYVTVEYAGSGANYNNADLTINSSAPVLRNCLLRNSAGSGVYLSSATNWPVIIDSEITGNKWGVYSSYANPYVTNTKIYTNTTAGVWNASTSPDVDARDNWWGAAAGPTYAGNPNGTGDRISDHVFYNPWLGQAPGTFLSITEARAVPSSLNPNGGYVTFTARISSSATWTITITDGNNNTVNTFTGNGTAVKQKWYGDDAQPAKVADGAYYYQISAVDPTNGNTASVPRGMITVSRQVPIVYMDPPVDNQMFTGGAVINITGTASDPIDFKNYTLDYGVGENPASWTMLKSSVTTPVTDGLIYAWNTTSLANGLYTLRLTVTDNAGNVVVDTARVRLLWTQNISASEGYISPNGDGIKDSTTINAAFTYESAWTVSINNSSGSTVKTYTGTGATLSQLWDGTNDVGGTVPEGLYTYRIDAVSSETNIAAAAKTGTITVDLTVPTAMITAPTANSILNSVVTIAGTAGDANFDGYRVEYGPEAGTGPWTLISTVTTSVANGTLTTWVTKDRAVGVLLANGGYVLRLTVTDKAGNTSIAAQPVTVDNLILSGIAANTHTINTFNAQPSNVFFTISSGATVTFKVISETTGIPVYQTSQACPSSGAYMFTWDGKDSTGKTVLDDAYLYILEASDGARTDSYSPPAPTGTGTVSCTQDTYNPYLNDPMTISYAVSKPSRISIVIPFGLSTIKVLDAAPHDTGNYTFDWDGRDRDGNVIMSATALCSVVSLLRENYILTSGDTPKISSVKTDPYKMSLSYGQFTRIEYSLSRDANVTITVISPSGATVPVISSQFQSVEPQVIEWTALDASDATGKKFLTQQEGPYAVKIQAVNPVTGSGSSTYGTVNIQE